MFNLGCVSRFELSGRLSLLKVHGIRSIKSRPIVEYFFSKVFLSNQELLPSNALNSCWIRNLTIDRFRFRYFDFGKWSLC
jgi:hypothetical protein